ncbi:hypothetical protein DFH11DRAFT_1743689 [Phellopilus nigrolimitatus]|nr:hypothetical protein DFH11DRAFT_1743689 [Phellopilus nigrolimitatus]
MRNMTAPQMHTMAHTTRASLYALMIRACAGMGYWVSATCDTRRPSARTTPTSLRARNSRAYEADEFRLAKEMLNARRDPRVNPGDTVVCRSARHENPRPGLRRRYRLRIVLPFAAIVYPIARYIERKFENHAGMRTAAEGATEHAAVAKHSAFLRSLTFNSTFRFYPLSNFVKHSGRLVGGLAHGRIYGGHFGYGYRCAILYFVSVAFPYIIT